MEFLTGCSTEGSLYRATLFSIMQDDTLWQFLDPATIKKVSLDLQQSEDGLSQRLGRYIADQFPIPGLQPPNGEIVMMAYVTPPPQEALDDIVRKATKDGSTIPIAKLRSTFDSAKSWGRALIISLFYDLRKLICGPRKKPSKLGTNSHSIISALGVTVAHSLGISNPVGAGIAVLILLRLADVSKSSLCRMTTPEELERHFA